MENEIITDNSNIDLLMNDSDYSVDSSLFSDIHFLSILNNILANKGHIALNEDVKVYNPELAYLFLYSDKILVKNINDYGTPVFINVSTYYNKYTEAFFDGIRKCDSDFSNFKSSNPNNIDLALESLKNKYESNWLEAKKFDDILNLKKIYVRGFYAGHLTKFIELSQMHSNPLSIRINTTLNYATNFDISYYFKLILENNLNYDASCSRLLAELSKNNVDKDTAIKQLQFYAENLFKAFEFNKYKEISHPEIKNRNFPLFIDYLSKAITKFSFEDISSIVSFFEDMSYKKIIKNSSSYEKDHIIFKFYDIIYFLNHQKKSYSNGFSPWGYHKDVNELIYEFLSKAYDYVQKNQSSDCKKLINRYLFEVNKLLSNDFEIDFASNILGKNDLDDYFSNEKNRDSKQPYFDSLDKMYDYVLKSDSNGLNILFRHSLFAKIAFHYLMVLSHYLNNFRLFSGDKLEDPNSPINKIIDEIIIEKLVVQETISLNKQNYSDIIQQLSLPQIEKDTQNSSYKIPIAEPEKEELSKAGVNLKKRKVNKITTEYSFKLKDSNDKKTNIENMFIRLKDAGFLNSGDGVCFKSFFTKVKPSGIIQWKGEFKSDVYFFIKHLTELNKKNPDLFEKFPKDIWVFSELYFKDKDGKFVSARYKGSKKTNNDSFLKNAIDYLK